MRARIAKRCGVSGASVLGAEPRERWSMDFTVDTLADGRGFRTLNVVDDFTRERSCVRRLARGLESTHQRRRSR
jgi:transposase InsO family protein